MLFQNNQVCRHRKHFMFYFPEFRFHLHSNFLSTIMAIWQQGSCFFLVWITTWWIGKTTLLQSHRSPKKLPNKYPFYHFQTTFLAPFHLSISPSGVSQKAPCNSSSSFPSFSIWIILVSSKKLFYQFHIRKNDKFVKCVISFTTIL